MSEERAPLSPQERAEQIRLAKERAVAARVAKESGTATVQPAATAPSITNPEVEAPLAAAAAPAAARPPRSEVAAPPGDRGTAIAAAKERAAAARASKEGGGVAQPPAAAQGSTPAVENAAPSPAAPAARATAPASPAERAAAIQAAKERAQAARAAAGGTPAPPAVAKPAAGPGRPAAAAAQPAANVDQRAAAVAQAQERAAALKVQRAGAAKPAAAPIAPAGPVPTWRVAANGKRAATQVPTARPEARSLEVAGTDAPARVVMRRRQLLRSGFWAGMGVLVAGSLATFADFFNPRDIKGFGGIVTIPSANVPKAGADPYHYLEGKVWLANLKPGEGVPAGFETFAPPSKDGGLLAMYQKCVHLGCTVPWRPEFNYQGVAGWFKCPCHGSTYTKGGVRVFGPAPRSLDTFLITKVDANGVSINTGKITLGGLDDPQRAVPAGPYA
ncbi:MAG: ubiquinol-cytochrome c reductase iron-sulfur subunit [Dehalococcoidia bacterium]